MTTRLLCLLAMCIGGITSGCAYSIHVNHTSDFQATQPLSEYRIVEARGEQFSFLGFVSQTDYVDDAFTALQNQCPRGQVTGIQTRYSTRLGFFSWTNVVRMQGYCSS